MCEAKFEHHDLRLVEPSFGSELTDLIIELEHLRKKSIRGTTHALVFFQLKHIFHTLESIGSARIEGNNTTIAEYIETKIGHTETHSPNIKEIQNLEETMSFIEEHINDTPINRIFISEIHKMIVNGLEPPPQGEGDKTPGEYRTKNVTISKSIHTPPDVSTISQYMDDLFEFINQKDSAKHDLLKIAMAHHRFVWIHPFTNGNGRTVRLFTYAMLVKLGFNVSAGRILNPTAIFCNDRNYYYRNLSEADKGTNEGLLIWCEYVLKGLKDEIEKIDKLADYEYLHKEILLPTIHHSLEREYITESEAKILKRVTDKQVVQASDLNDLFPGKVNSEISRQIRKLIEKKMLMPEGEGKRKYVIRFDNNYLLRGVIKSLGEKGFLPVKD
jgi:Fic family protein